MSNNTALVMGSLLLHGKRDVKVIMKNIVRRGDDVRPFIPLNSIVTGSSSSEN